jgi:hypothetical protein
MVIREPADFLTEMSGYVQADITGSSANRPVKFATIDPAFDPYAGLLPKVTFDGEGTLSGKRYPHVATYVPIPSDRVVLIPAGNTYLILGSVDTSTLPVRVLRTTYAAGAHTYTPADGMHSALVECQASGASGGAALSTLAGGTICAAGSGGGAGGYARSVISAETMPASVAVTVGASVAGTASTGTNGNASSFGSLLVCAGGFGGLTRNASAVAFGAEGGDSGGVSAGDVRIPGGAGHACFGSGQFGFSGNGGDSQLGHGGTGRATASTTIKLGGGAGVGFGSGGGGSFNSNGVSATNGGASAAGTVIVFEYF